MEEFQCGTRIVAGEGAVKVLREYGAKRVFVVTDPYFFKNGMARTVAQETGASQTEFFADVKPDPTVELAAEGTARLKAFGPGPVAFFLLLLPVVFHICSPQGLSYHIPAKKPTSFQEIFKRKFR